MLKESHVAVEKELKAQSAVLLQNVEEATQQRAESCALRSVCVCFCSTALDRHVFLSWLCLNKCPQLYPKFMLDISRVCARLGFCRSRWSSLSQMFSTDYLSRPMNCRQLTNKSTNYKRKLVCVRTVSCIALFEFSQMHIFIHLLAVLSLPSCFLSCTSLSVLGSVSEVLLLLN